MANFSPRILEFCQGFAGSDLGMEQTMIWKGARRAPFPFKSEIGYFSMWVLSGNLGRASPVSISLLSQ